MLLPWEETFSGPRTTTSVSETSFVCWLLHQHVQTDHIPQNISTVVDLLEAKNISWASCECHFDA